MAVLVERSEVRIPTLVPQSPRMMVQTYEVDQIDPWAIAQWRDLARRSCHHNPFLMPEFVLSSWRYLTPGQSNELVVVEDMDTGRWLALGAFRRGRISLPFPVPHAEAYRTEYTFRTGILLDAKSAPYVMDVFLTYLTEKSWFDHGVEFPGLRLDSRLARELAASTQRLGFEWRTHRRRMVPVVFPDLVSDAYWNEHWSKSRRKTLRRCRTRLEELGPVQLHLARDPEDVAVALENFLQLERDSWKGDEGTACLSQPHHAAWIRKTVMGLAQHGNVMISSLMAGERIAAVAINLTAGTSLFAFKIGWDSTLADASPGVLHEVELARETTQRLRGFTVLDSCATETAYIASLWPERIPVGTGMICATRTAKWSQRALNTARKVRSFLRRPESLPVKETKVTP